jgi:hypothetical protein
LTAAKHLRSLDRVLSQGERELEQDNLEYDDRAADAELGVLDRLAGADQKRKDSLYRKRSVREKTRRTGGVRPESPFFDE